MASLIPLLHDLLPIFMPSEVRIARGGELVAVEERAERPPWYRSVTPPAISSSEGYGADREGSTGAPPSGDFKPIQLLDHEESEQGPAAGRPHTAGQGGPVSSLHRGGPKVFRKNAMVGYSDKMCVTALTVQTQSATTIHHHGEQDVVIYATTPGVLLVSRSLDTVEALRADMKGEELTPAEEQPHRLELGAGDYAFVPAWTEHQVVNETMEKDINWVVFRQGPEPIQVDLDGWGGRRLKA